MTDARAPGDAPTSAPDETLQQPDPADDASSTAAPPEADDASSTAAPPEREAGRRIDPGADAIRPEADATGEPDLDAIEADLNRVEDALRLLADGTYWDDAPGEGSDTESESDSGSVTDSEPRPGAGTESVTTPTADPSAAAT